MNTVLANEVVLQIPDLSHGTSNFSLHILL